MVQNTQIYDESLDFYKEKIPSGAIICRKEVVLGESRKNDRMTLWPIFSSMLKNIPFSIKSYKFTASILNIANYSLTLTIWTNDLIIRYSKYSHILSDR